MAEDIITGLGDSDMSLSIDASVDLAKLGNSLSQAEAMVRASAQRMESALKINGGVGSSGSGGIPSYAGGKISGGGSGPNIIGGGVLGSFAGTVIGSGIGSSFSGGTGGFSGGSIGMGAGGSGKRLLSGGSQTLISQPDNFFAKKTGGMLTSFHNLGTGESGFATVGSPAYFDEIKQRTQNAWNTESGSGGGWYVTPLAAGGRAYGSGPGKGYGSPIGPMPSAMQSLRLASSRFSAGFKSGFKSPTMFGNYSSHTASGLGELAGEMTSVAGAGIAGGLLALKGIEGGANGASSFFDASHNMDIAAGSSGYRRYDAIARAQKGLGNIPIVGSGYTAAQNLSQSFARYSPTYAKALDRMGLSDLNFAAEKGQAGRENFDLSISALGGMGGFGNQRSQVNASYDDAAANLETQKGTIGGQLYNERKGLLNYNRSRDLMKINMASMMVNTDINNKTMELSFDAMGMGAAGRLYGTYHSYDNPIADNASKGNSEVVSNLLRQRNVAVGAQFMSGIKPSRAASAALMGGRDVAIGSSRGQDPQMTEKMLDTLSRMVVTPPKFARH